MLSERRAVDLEQKVLCYPSAIAIQSSNSILYATTDGKVRETLHSFIRAFGLVCPAGHLRFTTFLSDCSLRNPLRTRNRRNRGSRLCSFFVRIADG
jgi:hypothetical protein